MYGNKKKASRGGRKAGRKEIGAQRATRSAAWLATALLALAGWAVQPTAKAGDAGWRAEILRQRAEKDREFKSSATSPMAARQRLMVKPGRGGAIVLQEGVPVLAERPSSSDLIVVQARDLSSGFSFRRTVLCRWNRRKK